MPRHPRITRVVPGIAVLGAALAVRERTHEFGTGSAALGVRGETAWLQRLGDHREVIVTVVEVDGLSRMGSSAEVLVHYAQPAGAGLEHTALALPVLPGRGPAVRRFADELMSLRSVMHDASRRRLGIREEELWTMRLGGEPCCVLHISADDAEAAFAGLAGSTDAHDVFWRNALRENFGVDLAGASFRLPDVLYRWDPGVPALGEPVGAAG